MWTLGPLWAGTGCWSRYSISEVFFRRKNLFIAPRVEQPSGCLCLFFRLEFITGTKIHLASLYDQPSKHLDVCSCSWTNKLSTVHLPWTSSFLSQASSHLQNFVCIWFAPSFLHRNVLVPQHSQRLPSQSESSYKTSIPLRVKEPLNSYHQNHSPGCSSNVWWFSLPFSTSDTYRRSSWSAGDEFKPF